MTYDPAHTALLIAETDNAGTLVTHQERALRNQLQLAQDEIAFLRRALAGEAALLDYIAAHWESQRSDKQSLLGGRQIENPTGSLRDALRADIAAQDVGAS